MKELKMSVPSKAITIKLDNPAQAKNNQSA
jgi:hypothetical protein